MRYLKHTGPYIVSLLWMIFSIVIAYSQKQPLSTIWFDTTNLVVRVCQGDLPGQKKDPSLDYYSKICAYTFNNNKLATYTVTGFDLVYRGASNDSTYIASAEGDSFTPQMQNMIIKTADTAQKNLFIDNITITNKKDKSLVIRGLRPLVPQK